MRKNNMAPLLAAPSKTKNKRKINNREFSGLYPVKPLNILVNEGVRLLAIKLIADCYGTQKPRKEIIHTFLAGINGIRGVHVK